MIGDCGEFIIKNVLANQQSELVKQEIIIIYLFSKLVYQDILLLLLMVMQEVSTPVTRLCLTSSCAAGLLGS